MDLMGNDEAYRKKKPGRAGLAFGCRGYLPLPPFVFSFLASFFASLLASFLAAFC